LSRTSIDILSKDGHDPSNRLRNGLRAAVQCIAGLVWIDLQQPPKNKMKPYNPKSLSAYASLVAFGIGLLAPAAMNAQDAIKVNVNWNKTLIVSKTTTTTQFLASGYAIPGGKFYDQLYRNLQNLHTNFTRLQYWYPFPKLVVAELKPPTTKTTSWDFNYLDPLLENFFAATQGQRVMNFGTIPQWMFVTPEPVPYPANAKKIDYTYEQGSHLVDPTGKQAADYFARLFSWYTQGGFYDENGVFHGSDHHYTFPYWQVLNETVLEHNLTPQQYVTIYDAVTSAIHSIDPSVQFMGPEAAILDSTQLSFLTYFLDHGNHAPGTPIDWVTFHFYSFVGNSPADWQSEFFGSGSGSADSFIAFANSVNQARQALSPQTKIAVDELGSFSNPTGSNSVSGIATTKAPYSAYPGLYWVASGAFYAYCYENLAKLGFDVVSMSQMLGYPGDIGSITMTDWDNGMPNAHYMVLKLVTDNFGPGDTLVDTEVTSNNIAAQAFVTSNGEKLLLINKSDATVDVALPKLPGTVTFTVVDESSGENPPRVETVSNGMVTLAPFAVGVVSK
jgi:hypothetical protein